MGLLQKFTDWLKSGYFIPTPEPETLGYTLNTAKTVAVSNEVFWNTEMKDCPRGVKLQLLGSGNVASYSEYHGDKFWVGWSPLPKSHPKAVKMLEGLWIN